MSVMRVFIFEFLSHQPCGFPWGLSPQPRTWLWCLSGHSPDLSHRVPPALPRGHHSFSLPWEDCSDQERTQHP